MARLILVPRTLGPALWSREQGSFHEEASESGALGFASWGQHWGLYSPPLFPQPHHLNPPLPDSLISCPRCSPQGQEFCLGPVPPQASGQVNPGLQRPEEGPPTAWVWSTEPPCLPAPGPPCPSAHSSLQEIVGFASHGTPQYQSLSSPGPGSPACPGPWGCT